MAIGGGPVHRGFRLNHAMRLFKCMAQYDIGQIGQGVGKIWEGTVFQKMSHVNSKEFFVFGLVKPLLFLRDGLCFFQGRFNCFVQNSFGTNQWSLSEIAASWAKDCDADVAVGLPRDSHCCQRVGPDVQGLKPCVKVARVESFCGCSKS